MEEIQKQLEQLTLTKSESTNLQNSLETKSESDSNLTKSIHWLANKIQECNNIIVMIGAGVSTAAGIPDFRSKGSGLYDNLQKYNLPTPQSIFDLDFFRQNPKPFFTLVKELYPSNFKPTKSHHFIRLLHEKGKLLRCFSQNIDGLEAISGLPQEKIIQAHGGFSDFDKCIDCCELVSSATTKPLIMANKIPKCPKCSGLVKPQIVFFSEELPDRFYQHLPDFGKADLLIVMGTSLVVTPFGLLIHDVKKEVPRALINREPVREAPQDLDGFDFKVLCGRDVFLGGDCDGVVTRLAQTLNWCFE